MPAWLINRLAEGKPLAFVQRLEKVAAKWDGQAKTAKGVPSDGGGFGEHETDWIGLVSTRRTVGCELFRCSIVMTEFGLGFVGSVSGSAMLAMPWWKGYFWVLNICSFVRSYSDNLFVIGVVANGLSC